MWSGITAVGTKVYASPHEAPKLLVVDTGTDTAYGIETEGVYSGKVKWSGITAVGTKVYAAPDEAPKLLVADTVTDTAYGIDTEGVQSSKAPPPRRRRAPTSNVTPVRSSTASIPP